MLETPSSRVEAGICAGNRAYSSRQLAYEREVECKSV